MLYLKNLLLAKLIDFNNMRIIYLSNNQKCRDLKNTQSSEIKKDDPIGSS